MRLLVLLRLGLALEVLVYYSLRTPVEVTRALQSTVQGHRLDFQASLHFITSTAEITLGDSEAALDYLYDAHLSHWLQEAIPAKRYLLMWGRANPAWTSELRLYADTFSSFLLALNFTNVQLISSSEFSNLASTRYMTERYPTLYRASVSTVPSGSGLDFAMRYVGKAIKPRGICLVAIFTDPVTAGNLLSAFEAKKLNKPGYAFVLSQEASLYRYGNYSSAGLQSSGVLFVADPAAVAPSRTEFEGVLFLQQLALVTPNSISPRKAKYAFFYLTRGKPEIASETPEALSSTPVLYPGNATQLPQDAIPSIRASVNYALLNPDLSIDPRGLTIMRGYQLAFWEVNNRSDLIPGYRMEDFAVNYTLKAFNGNYTRRAVQGEKKNLGAVYIAQTSAVGALMQIFQQMNVTLPLISCVSDDDYSSASQYPLLIKASTRTEYLLTILCRVIKYWGWTHLALIYTDGAPEIRLMYSQLLDLVRTANISITNSNRTLPLLLSNQTFTQMDAVLNEIFQSRTRIILILHRSQNAIIDRMYALGVRQGYVLLLFNGLSDDSFSSYPNRQLIAKGAIQFSPRQFIGSKGAEVESELNKLDPNGVFAPTCMYYDSAFLYFYATDFLLEHGLDYEDPGLIVSAMRESYFTGCSGFVKLGSDTNDRRDSEIEITNLQYTGNASYVIKTVGSYNPDSSQPYQLTSTLQWPDDQKTYSDLKPFYPNCPQLLETVAVNGKGVAIGLAIGYSLCAVASLACVLIWRRVWKHHFPLLRERKMISIEDVTVFGVIIAEFFQFAALGPDTAQLSPLIAYVNSLVHLDLLKLISIGEGHYWLLLDGIFGLTGLWLCVSLLKLCKLDQKCSFIEYWTDLLLPILGNLLFIPIVSLVLQVFLCYHGTSEQISDTFLNKDCYSTCWSGKHLAYSIAGGFALLIYIPLAVYTRPLWQLFQAPLNVFTQPSALMLKSIVQLVLITSAATLQNYADNAHAGVFFTVLTVYTAMLIKSPPFNYHRVNLWQVLTLIAVLALSVISHVLNQLGTDHSLEAEVALMVSFSLLAVTGLALQLFVKAFEAKLMRRKAKDLRGLFVFAFTFGRRAQMGLSYFYESNAPETFPRTSQAVPFEVLTPPQT